MKKCRYTPYHKFIKWFYISVFTAVSLLLASIGIYLFLDIAILSDNFLIGCALLVFCVAIGTFTATIGIKAFLFENRRFAVSENGISFNYSDGATYKWDDVDSICILRFAARADLNAYETVICVFLSHPSDRTFRKLLRGYIYAAIRMKEMVIIDYSDEILSEISTHYPRGVQDFRDKQRKLWELGA